MGLPSSSISQCRKVEVWTWQDGPASSVYSFIDLALVESGDQVSVPDPEPRPIPDMWRTAGTSFDNSGTLVVWSELDRCLWKTGLTIINNSEHLIGRMYRRFISSSKARIRMASFVDDTPSTFDEERYADPNDPLYLTVPSSTPEPFSNSAMFRRDGDCWEVTDEIEYENTAHPVVIRFTIAKEDARNRPNAGSTPHGKHAKKNIGVSLMRADRELELDASLVIQYDPRERWWGVEVEFPPGLDEIFGVTNNKQAARNFTETAATLEVALADADHADGLAALKEKLSEESDPRGPLIDVVHLIHRRLRDVRKLIEVQRRGTRRTRHEIDSPEKQGTSVTRRRQKAGYRGRSDIGETLPVVERATILTNELVNTGLSREQAEGLAARTIREGLKYTFATADLEGSTFFTVKGIAGELLIKLNLNHPAFEHLVEVLQDDADEDIAKEQLIARLNQANRGLKLLLMAWARFEDEAFPDSKREEVQDLRHEWGRYAAQFLRDDR